MQHSRWIAKLGAMGYDFLILLNRFINFLSKKIGKGPVSMSKQIKNGVKSAIKFISDFEQTAADIAIDKKFDYVVCGHIHQPQIKMVETEKGAVLYLNSGDWVENLTALEYHQGNWELYQYNEDTTIKNSDVDIVDTIDDLEKNALFELLQEEFNNIEENRD